jgi:hypothetical protein
MSEAILIQKLKNYDAFYPSGGIQVIPPPVTPAIGTMPQILDFGDVTIDFTSVKSYRLSVSNLVPNSGNITITAPTGFAISLSENTGYASILTIPYTDDHLIYGFTSILIYVKFSPISVQNYDNVLPHSGGGAVDYNLVLLGDGIEPVPEDLQIVGIPFAGVDLSGLKVFVWGTNYPSTSKIWWGTAADALVNTFPQDDTLVAYHRVSEFIGVIDTTIYYKVVSTTPAGGYVESDVYAFSVSNIVAFPINVPNIVLASSTHTKDKDVSAAFNLSDFVVEGASVGYPIDNYIAMEGQSKTLDENVAQEVKSDDTFTGFVAVTGVSEKRITVGGVYTDSVVRVYKIQIDGVGSPDTFMWSDDNGATWTETTKPCSTSAYALNHGVTVLFDVATGHTAGQFWTFNRKPL